MSNSSLARRAAIAAACLGATAAVGASPAFAATAGQNIYGSGSSLQKIAQQNIWTPLWQSTPADHPQLTNSPTATYTSSSSGAGLAEFGNTTGTLDKTQDPTANAAGQLDAYVGTDDPPTTPNLTDASTAATGSSSPAIKEVTVPVAQAPVAVLLSLPTGLTVGSGTQIKLSNAELQSIWNANVPPAGGYATKTWGALLAGAGLTKVTGTPGPNQFSDTGGGTHGITLQVRSTSSGTSYTFKGFLNLSGDPLYTSTYVTDADIWPVTTTNTGNTGGSQEVADTTANPGSVGYANLADAAAATPAYTNTPTSTTTGGTHQIAYALVQDNKGGTGTQYADPEVSSGGGKANVYTGSAININGTSPSNVGHWTVPVSGSTFTPTGTWGGTQASDPDVYDHSGKITKYYPIVASTYDLGWTKYSQAGSHLVGQYGASPTAAGTTANSLLTYIVGTGQNDLVNANKYYAKLPSTIDSYGVKAAAAVQP